MLSFLQVLLHWNTMWSFLQVFFDIYNKGIDEEDIRFLKRTYDDLMQSEDPLFYWLNDILWVDHPFTNIPDPPRKRRKVDDNYQNRTYKTGSARTDGYYKITLEEKARYLSQERNVFLATKQLDEKVHWLIHLHVFAHWAIWKCAF